MSEISVVVPCYNGQEVLPRCLDSLLRQTIPLEIIVVNDGSTDDTLSVAERYAQRHTNIRIVTKENQGLPQARKSGLEAATGAYIGFVDSDDWAEPEMFERLYHSLEKAGAEVACGGLYKTYDNGEKRIERQKFRDGAVISSAEALHALHCRRDIFPYMWNKLYRRDVFQGVVFPEGNFTGEDYVTTIQILQRARNISVVNTPLYHYWQSVSSMSRGGFKPSHVLSWQNYQKAAGALILSRPETRKDVCCYLAVEYMSFVIAMSRNAVYDAAMLREIQSFIRKNLTAVLGARDISILYKGSAAAMAIHPGLLTAVYRTLNK